MKGNLADIQGIFIIHYDTVTAFLAILIINSWTTTKIKTQYTFFP